jgi:polyisoprenoid-binding protein YceI
MKTIAPLLIAATLSTGAFAADRYSIDTRHTFPYFQVSHLGFSHQAGRFNKVTGSISLDPQAGKGSAEVSIDTASIDMGLEDWDKHMRSADFFNVEQHPSMTFKADAFTFEAGKPVAAEGTLTLLGVTKPVKLAIANFSCGIHPLNRKTVCGANLTTSIKRSQFGMTKYLPGVGDEVFISIPVEAFKE